MVEIQRLLKPNGTNTMHIVKCQVMCSTKLNKDHKHSRNSHKLKSSMKLLTSSRSGDRIVSQFNCLCDKKKKTCCLEDMKSDRLDGL